jgi:putative SOS response-associated peptidase YedK
MCGRIALYSDPDRLARILEAQISLGLDQDHWQRSWNVGPTATILGVSGRPGGGPGDVRVLAPYRWGLVPRTATDPAALRSTFNARAETLASKPTFRSAFRRGRILVPVDAFYEWHTEGTAKTPHVFQRADGEPIVFAGLADRWTGPDHSIVHSATIITTGAGPDMEGIHHRMPVVLERGSWDHWLGPDDADRRALTRLLQPAPAGTLVHHQVDRSVGNVRNDGPELLGAATLP